MMSYGGGHLGFVVFWCYFGGERLVALAVSVPGNHKMAQMKGEDVLMSIDVLVIMLLLHVTMEKSINMVARPSYMLSMFVH